MGLQDYRIRDAVKFDFSNGYLDLLKQHHNVSEIPKDKMLEQFENIKKKTQYYLRVVENKKTGKIVASGCLFIEFKFGMNLGKVAYVDDLIVDTNLRGKGLGTFLLNHLKKLAMANGCRQINILVDEKHENFVKRSGFDIGKKHYSLEL